AWVFFRAKEWDDALKVLGGMVSLDTIVLPEILSNKLSFLNQFDVHFGNPFVDIHAGYSLLVWLLLGCVIVFRFRNSMELLRTFKVNMYHILFVVFALFVSFFHIQRYSEFIYFNF
ncbi:membrane-bound O-acyltransferase family protein, partial [Sulfurovum lithotrophicum]